MHDLFSNAPAEWPQIQVQGLIASHAPEIRTANAVNFANTIEAAFRQAKLQVLEVNAYRLTREGILEVPLRLHSGGNDYDVFFYPLADLRAAAHFAGVMELAQKWGRINPIFYSTGDLRALGPVVPQPVVQLERFYLESLPLTVKGQYAMWWADKPGEQFHFSSTFDLYDRIYNEINGLEMRTFALLLREIGQIQEEYEFTAGTFTDTTIELPLSGPEDVPLLVTFSQHRGLRFHFHMGLTSPEYRLLFLNLFLLRVKQWKQESGLDQMKRLDSPSYIWWRELGKRLRFTATEQANGTVGSVKR